ncbi:MAG: hypothetical protein JF887_05475 [Candidatus Dormibacteraeota bacterium]|uniref:Uncharacterized protein n=1 Tax=Candidatus Amunia macphersoniae TaxID=3127014 RepID=A0A934KN78_9BACT|nr:hypothetical protein [Candidatus Dormibacteraeota bacterium]
MADDFENPTEPKSRERIVQRLDKMVASGRVTETEAARLRAAAEPDQFDEAVRSIRVRHAGVRLDAAVESGEMTQEEADGYLTRLKQGEHPRGLRSHLGMLRRKSRS